MNSLLNTTLILLPSLICILALLKTMVLIKENLSLSRELRKTVLQLRKAGEQPAKVKQDEDIEEFKDSLTTAEVTTKLQQPRLQVDGRSFATSPSTISEKYSFIESMSQNGMDPKQIASILSLSIDEVKQVMTLSNLTKNQSPIIA
jgi:hypothetical protein